MCVKIYEYRNVPLRFFCIANTASGGLLGPGLSGGDRIALESLKRWSACGNTITIMTSTSGQFMYQRYLQPSRNVQYNVLKTPAFKKYNMATLVFYTLFTLIKGFKEAIRIRGLSRFDIVCSLSDFWPDSIPGWVIKMRNMNAKWVASFYLFAPNPFSDEFPYKGLSKLKGLIYYLSQWPIYWFIRKYADMVWVTSEPDRWKFVDGRLSPNKVIAVQGGVDVKTPALIPEPKEKRFDVVFIGRFHPQKGILELIDIWRYVIQRKKDAKLAIIGVGDLEGAVRAKIRKYGLEGNITLFGFKDGVEKLKIFKDSKVVVHPATYDSGGMAACEAMACGLPGVSFDLPALKTYYPKGMLKAPCYDLKAFAENILNLLNDEKLYSKTSKDALDWAEKWDWDKRAEELLETIKRA